ncbi:MULTISPECIES: flagellar hook protein FlgE [unclassified Pseudomonas]|uniref:flagellar hook protein FlgE n=1 Tax=unclassified Pseudomonas TaxID=196821 RepID=UPI002AC95754|nr:MULTISPECIES: flagellar hook protein FlgE [unclassified Pseudomonas]MEB0041394.1 flagellar hook protein FlgE [Pseudomonas sp. MH10]MEB0078670.1 flagellar hook protein FlgE [Pseudomonas sp. MH10out]MEB0093944.1 flagellar hook protein FlgE [Pseudomonas sp. CCI4.2]MEB0103734.1 flagellar hook protein FlgE [Pseudomonas sp. CCI3.2]MEB0121191.1 flagellar hook protein FlgE [Pseudomonas sp. CCI1.2]
MSFNIGLSGLYAANKSLDVTGNNIANVATTGFKSSRTEFQDQYSAAVSGASGATNSGSGVRVAAVSQQFTQGNLTTGTGRSLDLAIQGNGFFMVSDNGEKLYTRDGAFYPDKDGNIVNSSGQKLQGYSVDASGKVVTGVSTNLVIDSSNLTPKPTSLVTIASNLDSTATVPKVTSFTPGNTASYNFSVSTPIFDSQGNQHSLDQYMVKTGTNDWTMYTLVDGRNAKDPTSTTPDSLALTFNTDGSLKSSASPTANLAVNTDGTYTLSGWVPATQSGTPLAWGANGASGNTAGIQINMLTTTQTNAASGVATKSQDGYATGQLAGLSVDSTGVLFATYTNSQSKVIGQVSITNFANSQGLISVGGSSWKESFASGVPVTGAPQTGTLGSIVGSALEDSNVDLTSELVALIREQSNYQANAKTISTQSAIMQTTIQMVG